jgi:hypothetical protein
MLAEEMLYQMAHSGQAGVDYSERRLGDTPEDAIGHGIADIGELDGDERLHADYRDSADPVKVQHG